MTACQENEYTRRICKMEEENLKQIHAWLGLEAFWYLQQRILYLIELKFKMG